MTVLIVKVFWRLNVNSKSVCVYYPLFNNRGDTGGGGIGSRGTVIITGEWKATKSVRGSDNWLPTALTSSNSVLEAFTLDQDESELNCPVNIWCRPKSVEIISLVSAVKHADGHYSLLCAHMMLLSQWTYNRGLVRIRDKVGLQKLEAPEFLTVQLVQFSPQPYCWPENHFSIILSSSSVSIVTRLRTGRLGFNSWQE
jgi:hypothetical protein